MNRFRAVNTLAALLVIVCIAVAGAGKYSEKTLLGTWEFDMLAMYEQATEKSGQQMPPGIDMKTIMGDSFMRITFMKDGKYTFESRTMQNLVSEKGTWELVENKDNVLTIKSVNDEGKEQIISMSFADNDHFEARMDQGEMEMTMSAARVKDAKKEKKKD